MSQNILDWWLCKSGTFVKNERCVWCEVYIERYWIWRHHCRWRMLRKQMHFRDSVALYPRPKVFSWFFWGGKWRFCSLFFTTLKWKKVLELSLEAKGKIYLEAEHKFNVIFFELIWFRLKLQNTFCLNVYIVFVWSQYHEGNINKE